MKYYRILFLGICLALTLNAAAQSRRQVKAQELELSGDYPAAIELYKQDMAKKGKSVAALEGIAHCYFAMGDFAQAESFYAQLLERSQRPAHKLSYAEVLLRNGKYAAADSIARKASTDTTLTRHITAACANAMKWESEGEKREVINLTEVNSCYSDWGAQLYTAGKMIFISDRPMEKPDCTGKPGATFAGGFTAQGEENDTVAMTDWSSVRMMPYPFNDKGRQIGPIAVSPNDSTTVYYTRSSTQGTTTRQKVGHEIVRKFSNNLEIYSAKQTEHGWELVTPFEHNNAKLYSVMHPALSPNGKTLYFVSNMPGGVGGYDIWTCDLQSSGAWGKPTNPGAPVNTVGNEMFPTVGANGTLYFSSNRHGGMGGLDIFSTKKVRNKWQPVQNLKSPFNSGADDFFYIENKDNKEGKDSVAYISSNRAGGAGSDDIYMISLRPLKSKVEPVDTTPIDTVPVDTTPIVVDTVVPVPLPELTPVAVVVPEDITLNGKMLDKQTRATLAGVKICATQDASKTSECRECDGNGSFSFALKDGERYTLSAFKEGYQSTAPMRLLATQTLAEEELTIEMTAKEKAAFVSAEAVIDRTKIVKKLLPREYRIQVLANLRETDYDYFETLRRAYPQFELQYTRRDQARRFTYGSFVNLAEARRYLRLFINLGYTDSFIAVFEYGKQTESIFSGGAQSKVAPKRKPAPNRKPAPRR
ncbi:MAG: tetratricopeptide repeat protein [Prevotellaceae bacterium]|jgi:hypothetical protein|nr:tetratricopeptide repeat protein [Prevotellaceae bacterium]